MFLVAIMFFGQVFATAHTHADTSSISTEINHVVLTHVAQHDYGNHDHGNNEAPKKSPYHSCSLCILSSYSDDEDLDQDQLKPEPSPLSVHSQFVIPAAIELNNAIYIGCSVGHFETAIFLFSIGQKTPPVGLRAPPSIG